MKTNQVNYSLLDKTSVLKMINNIKNQVTGQLPNIYLLHGEMTDSEINQLNNEPKVKAFVSFTKGEGFGRPLLESAITGKPTIVSNWSGHIDYLNPEFTTLLQGSLKKVHPSAANNMLLKEAEWFNVDTIHVGHYLRDMFENYKKYKDLAKRQGYYSRTNFSFEKMKEKLDKVLGEKTSGIPKQVELKLPKLKKIGENKTELPKLKLPKLKKV